MVIFSGKLEMLLKDDVIEFYDNEHSNGIYVVTVSSFSFNCEI